VLALVEGLFTEMLPVVAPHKRLLSPFPRMSYTEALERFGSDKPDLRFGLELVDLTDVLGQSEFSVFRAAVEAGGKIKAVRAPGCAGYSRRELDELAALVKGQGAKGLATLALAADGVKGPAAKFLKEGELDEVRRRTEAQAGDLICLVADQPGVVVKSLSALRLTFRDRLALADGDLMAFGWVVDFPMFEWNEQEKRWDAAHHPFTMPKREHFDKLESDPASVLSDAYDLVCNGYELASGSIRIHDRETQRRIFRLLNYPDDQIQARFGHMPRDPGRTVLERGEVGVERVDAGVVAPDQREDDVERDFLQHMDTRLVGQQDIDGDHDVDRRDALRNPVVCRIQLVAYNHHLEQFVLWSGQTGIGDKIHVNSIPFGYFINFIFYRAAVGVDVKTDHCFLFPKRTDLL